MSLTDIKKLSEVNWEIIVETKNGITTTKEVLYKKDGTEVVWSTKSVDINVELAKFEKIRDDAQNQIDILAINK